MMKKTMFQAPSSSFDPSFWEELYNLKLNIFQLDSNEINITSHMSLNLLSDKKHFNSLLHFTSTSLDNIQNNSTSITSSDSSHNQDQMNHDNRYDSIRIRGILKDFNTIEVYYS